MQPRELMYSCRADVDIGRPKVFSTIKLEAMHPDERPCVVLWDCLNPPTIGLALSSRDITRRGLTTAERDGVRADHAWATCGDAVKYWFWSDMSYALSQCVADCIAI